MVQAGSGELEGINKLADIRNVSESTHTSASEIFRRNQLFRNSLSSRRRGIGTWRNQEVPGDFSDFALVDSLPQPSGSAWHTSSTLVLKCFIEITAWGG